MLSVADTTSHLVCSTVSQLHLCTTLRCKCYERFDLHSLLFAYTCLTTLVALFTDCLDPRTFFTAYKRARFRVPSS